MTVREVTRRIVENVESTTGHPVVICEDQGLTTLASRVARGDAQPHTITYNPTIGPPDYLIAFQCGFILRAFDRPPAQRLEFAPLERGRAIVQRLLKAQQPLPPSIVETVGAELFHGLMRQLRSMPVGMRVDTWILNEYEELAELQRTAALRQLQDNQKALAPEVRKMAPSKVYQSSLAMNAAFAAFWRRQLQDPTLDLPYRAAGYHERGTQLLRLVDELPHSAEEDTKLIDAWAGTLTLVTWYEWIPLEGQD